MKINHRIAQFLQLFGLIVLLWSVFFVVRFFLQRNSESVVFSAPVSADILINIDGGQLINSAMFSTFIEKKDANLAMKLRKLFVKNENSSSKKNVFIGVDVFQSVQFFSDYFNDQRLSGIILKIHTPELWDANSTQLFGQNALTIREGNSGLILISEVLNKSQLEVYFNKNKSSFLRDKSKFSQDNLLEYQQDFSVNSGNILNQIKTQINIKHNLLSLKGKVIPTENLHIEEQRYQLKPNNLSVNGRILPKLWNDMLYDFCAKNLDSLPIIQSFSLNYSGLELISTKNQVVPLPAMELLLTFEDPFSIIDFAKNVIEKKEADVRLFDDFLQIGEKLYYFRQIDSHSIYLGITKNPIIEKVKNQTVLSVKGSPKNLINIKGSRFVTAMIKMSESYQAFETLLNATESIELEVSRKNRKELVYTGEFRFETGESATNEFLKFMLSMESVR